MTKSFTPNSIIILLLLIFLSNCESDSSSEVKANKEVQRAPELEKESDHMVNTDTAFLDTTSFKVIPAEPKKNSGTKTPNIPQKKPLIDDNFQNVMDDPNYIGTPCLIIDGKCVRHNHKTFEIK